MKTENAYAGSAYSIELDVTGMTCGACERHVHKALTTMPGVSGVSVSYATATARIELNGVPDTDALVAAVRAAGYDARVARAANPDTEPDSKPRVTARCGCCEKPA